MLVKFLYLFIFINFIGSYSERISNKELGSNVLACPDDKACVSLNSCPDIVKLMKEDTLPIHRFKQAVCGYTGANPKVCCISPKDVDNFDPDTTANLTSSEAQKSSCGRSFVNSEYADIGSYPFIVRIGFINLNDESIKYSCTGTIINERTVVTTASCALATAEDYKIHSVLVGEYDTKTDPDCNSLFCAHPARSHNISYIVKHPNYNAEKFEKNIALIRLNETIDFTLTSQPVCYSERQYATVGSATVLVGWGKLLDSKGSSEQGIVPMKILSLQDCEYYHDEGFNVELCAVGQKEPCSGYSGSPLLYRERDCYILIGMLSYGTSCDLKKNTPSAFVSIRKYAMWIAENS